ncbi:MULTISPECIES: hypothetical protein [unclassified Sphingopyxis]|uniref:hypothetical protein n=1 Tax=unclassified Sphingopyxis TaxID=2614943 RepID=UPI00285AFDF7|nr:MULTISPECIES: hypothetical protein [unclassified Sphingopyxis]MDR6834609.1 hypothetical protein [Sphingopyxis sp. BE122]MDR7226879.1 hypothetical protein [Sphingopyxis sp. BE259]
MSIALGAITATTLGGCYYGDVYGTSYASGGDCAARYGSTYYDYDGYAYDDGYGYDCYDASDYGGGFVNIGFGGGWYDDYYYPGYGLWMFDNYRNRYPLRDRYLNYWGGRRAWWKHHGGRGDGQPGRPGGWHRGDSDGRPGDGRPGRPGGWNRGDRNDSDGPRGTRPGRGPGDGNGGTPPVSGNPGRPDWTSGRPRPEPQNGVGRPRPIRNLPATEPGEIFSAPRPGADIRRPARADRPAPVVRQPPTAQSAPPVRAAPRPAAAPPRAAPPPAAAPEPRPAPVSRADRQNKVRED